jgi:hypothetical protein
MMLKKPAFELIAVIAIFHLDVVEGIPWGQVQVDFFYGVIVLIVVVDGIVEGEFGVNFFL